MAEAEKKIEEITKEIDEKCVRTAWLKPLYDDLYNRLNQYANDSIKQMRNEGYKVEFIDAAIGSYSYVNSAGEQISKVVTTKITSISHIALSGIYGDSELVSTWKKHITDKDNQILFLYIPIAAGALFDTAAAYMTAFDVLTLD